MSESHRKCEFHTKRVENALSFAFTSNTFHIFVAINHFRRYSLCLDSVLFITPNYYSDRLLAKNHGLIWESSTESTQLTLINVDLVFAIIIAIDSEI